MEEEKEDSARSCLSRLQGIDKILEGMGTDYLVLDGNLQEINFKPPEVCNQFGCGQEAAAEKARDSLKGNLIFDPGGTEASWVSIILYYITFLLSCVLELMARRKQLRRSSTYQCPRCKMKQTELKQVFTRIKFSSSEGLQSTDAQTFQAQSGVASGPSHSRS